MSAGHRPPPIVTDDNLVRRDILSDDVRRVHPDLMVDGTAEERREHQHRCDLRAYERIRHLYPLWMPPGCSSRSSSSASSS